MIHIYNILYKKKKILKKNKKKVEKYNNIIIK